MKKPGFVLLLSALIVVVLGFAPSQHPTKTLKGVWRFNGGIYNGKPDGAPKGYKLQRTYTGNNFTAFASQPGYKTERYEAGTYLLKGDTCFETSTFSSRPSQLVGKTVGYIFTVKNNMLTLSGKLPSGMVVEEHWVSVL